MSSESLDQPAHMPRLVRIVDSLIIKDSIEENDSPSQLALRC